MSQGPSRSAAARMAVAVGRENDEALITASGAMSVTPALRPTGLARAIAVRGATAGDLRSDLAALEESPVLVEVVAFVGEQPVGGTASGVPSAKPRGADGPSLGPRGSAA